MEILLLPTSTLDPRYHALAARSRCCCNCCRTSTGSPPMQIKLTKICWNNQQFFTMLAICTSKDFSSFSCLFEVAPIVFARTRSSSCSPLCILLNFVKGQIISYICHHCIDNQRNNSVWPSYGYLWSCTLNHCTFEQETHTIMNASWIKHESIIGHRVIVLESHHLKVWDLRTTWIEVYRSRLAQVRSAHGNSLPPHLHPPPENLWKRRGMWIWCQYWSMSWFLKEQTTKWGNEKHVT